MWRAIVRRLLLVIGRERAAALLLETAQPPAAAEPLPRPGFPTVMPELQALGVQVQPQRGAGPWHALPGQVMELGDSGFQIQLDLRQARYPYVLRSPEGAVIGYGSDLPGLKTLGERFAAERQEFAFRGASR